MLCNSLVLLEALGDISVAYKLPCLSNASDMQCGGTYTHTHTSQDLTLNGHLYSLSLSSYVSLYLSHPSIPPSSFWASPLTLSLVALPQRFAWPQGISTTETVCV